VISLVTKGFQIETISTFFLLVFKGEKYATFKKKRVKKVQLCPEKVKLTAFCSPYVYIAFLYKKEVFYSLKIKLQLNKASLTVR